jgi:hypothetical protein
MSGSVTKEDVIKHGYAVTPEGRILSARDWRGMGVRELAQDANSDGYPSVRLQLKNRVRLPVYRLVALFWLPVRPNKAYEIRHLDGDKQNSCATNLKWGTRKENAMDREAHERTSRGTLHGDAIRRGLAIKKARGES